MRTHQRPKKPTQIHITHNHDQHLQIVDGAAYSRALGFVRHKQSPDSYP